MIINGTDIDISGISPLVDFLTGQAAGDGSSNQIDSGSYEQNINGDGKLSLSWRSNSGGGINAGTVVTIDPTGSNIKYYMKENYVPTPNGDGTYTWSPTFVSVDEQLKGILIYKEITVYRNDTVNNGAVTKTTKDIKIYTFPYYGRLDTLIALLEECDGVDSGVVQIGGAIGNEEVNVSVSFDQDNLVSACEKIASALGTNITIVDGVITIGPETPLAVSEHYDRFVIFGGTRNMGKHVVEGDETYAAVTMRLTLDEQEYPDSILPQPDPGAAGHMTKILIFDDIYPEMKLSISSVRARTCYLYDENGNMIVTVVNGEEVPKTYTKYYIKLQLNKADYDLNVKSIIEGRTLGIVFHTGLLAGREFDLAYYDDGEGDEEDEETHEIRHYTDETSVDEDVIWYEEDDVDHEHPKQSWRTYDGEYRICIVADGDTLLPNTSLEPHVGDVVTLTGVALDGSYEKEAKDRLLAAAQPYVDLYMNPRETSVDVSSNEEEVITDFMTGDSQSVSPGDSHSGSSGGQGDYMVTSVTTDLLSGKQTVKYGTFEPQGRMASMANQLTTATVGTSGATVGQASEDYIRHTAAMSLDQFKTLYDVYGHLGMKKVNNRVADAEADIQDLFTDMGAVQLQTDRKIDLWFRKGEPLPNIYKPNDTANLPASNWTEEEKPGHDQDLYYDNRRLALGSTDCRVWRWEEVELTTNGTTTKKWLWNEVTDAQTIAALELIADVASDGILSAGAEKSRVLVEWRAAAADHADLATRVKSFNASAWQAYDAAYQALCDMLNNGATYSSGTPLWLDEDHILTNTTIDDPDDYRDVWNEYYEALAALTGEITAKKCSVFVGARNNPPSPPYNVGDMWIVTDEDNKVLYCVTGKAANGTYDAADWQEMTAQPDARTLLIALAEEVYASGVFTGNVSAVTVQLAAGGQSSLSPAPSQISSSLSAALAGCYDAFGAEDIVITLGSTPQSGNETFDLALIPITFQDPVLQNNVNGGFDILMYNAKNHWEMISKSTTALIENLGSAIRLLVFGSANGSMSDVITGSGIVTQEDFTKIFAEAQMWDDTSHNYVTIAEALFGIEVEPVRNSNNQILYYDDNGNSYTEPGTGRKPHYVSSAKLNANYINFNAQGFSLDADKINFSGKTVNISGATSINLSTEGTLNLNAATVLFNAEKINWFPEQSATTESDGHKYRDIITGTNQGVTEKKFRVDDEGNVTMNNATVLGTIYANAGKIGGTNGWTIATNQISKGTLGDDGSMFLSTVNIDGTGLSSSHPLHHNNLRFTVGSKFGVLSDGTLVASNALLSGNFKTAGGKIEISETDRGSYNWYGLAYVGSYGTDSVAIGMRDYGSNAYGGHISLLGNGGNGGIFDVLTGGQTTQSSLIMGSSLQHIGVSIDGVGKSIKIGDSDYRYSTPSETNYLSFHVANDGSTPKGYMIATGGLNIGGNTNVNGLSVSQGNVCLPCVIKTSSFTLPVGPSDGLMYICKGNGSDLVVTTTDKPITYGNHYNDEVGTNSSKNYEKDSFILVYSATMSKWVLLWCGG